MHNRVHSKKVKCERWYRTGAEAIAAFEQKCKRAGIEPPHDYPPDLTGECFTYNRIDYPHLCCWAA